MFSVNDIIFSHRSFFNKIVLRAHVFCSMYENRTRQSPDLSAYRLIKRKKRQTMCFHSLFVHTFIMFITLLIQPKKTYDCFFGLGIEKFSITSGVTLLRISLLVVIYMFFNIYVVKKTIPVFV